MKDKSTTEKKTPTFEEVWMEQEKSDPVVPLTDAARKAREAVGADVAAFVEASKELDKEGSKK